MEYFPKSNSDIQQSHTGHSASYPTGRDHGLQPVPPGFARRVKQKVIVTPITQPEHALRNPRQQREEYAYFQAKNDVENDAKFG